MTKQHSNYSDLITFTRASKGHALRPVSYGTELVTNGGFDTDSDWTKESAWTISNGVASFDASINANLQQANVGLEVGKIYQLRFEITTGVDANFSLFASGSSDQYIGYTDYAVGTHAVNFICTGGDGVRIAASRFVGSSFSIDNISLKEVTFDQPDGTLTLFEHPNNIPRVEYDADGNRLGLLVEEARTNLILNSSDFSVGSWTKSSSSISAATNITAPDGTTNSFKLIEDSSTNAHRVQGAQAVGGTTSTMSCFMKKAERSWGNINFAGLTQGQAWFDLENGVLGTVQTAVTASIEDYGNGWYRCSVTATPTSAATTDIKVANNDESVSYTGDGTSGIYIFGAQTEAGSFPTSYIKSNSGSTTTRSADVAELEAENFGYNLDAGTIFYEGQDIADNYSGAINSSGGFHVWFGANNDNYAGGLYHGSTGLSDVSYYKGSGTLETAVAGTDLSGNGKVAFAYDLGNSISVSIDGSTAVTATATTPTAYNNFDWKIRLGSGTTGTTTSTSVYVKQLKFYPRRLTNAQLQDLTS